MGKLARKSKRNRATGLASQVEKVVVREGRDADPNAHLEYFFRTFKDDLLLPEIDLSTPEGAKRALETLREKSEVLDKRARTIRALRKVSESESH